MKTVLVRDEYVDALVGVINEWQQTLLTQSTPVSYEDAAFETITQLTGELTADDILDEREEYSYAHTARFELVNTHLNLAFVLTPKDFQLIGEYMADQQDTPTNFEECLLVVLLNRMSRALDTQFSHNEFVNWGISQIAIDGKEI